MSGQPLTPQEVADLVRCSRRTVMRAIARGDLEASRLGDRGCWRIWPDAIDRWRQSRQPVTPAPARLPERRGRLRVTDQMGRGA